MFRRAPVRAAAALLAVTAGLAACGEPAGDETDDDPQAGISGVTFRVWDPEAATAYRESFDAFNAIYPEIHVEVEVVPRPSYSSRATSDAAAGTMPDLFWTTTSSLTSLVEDEQVVNLGEELDVDLADWQPAVTDLYTREGHLWAVPQVAHATVLYYNSDLVAQADVDPAALTWAPPAPDPEDGGPEGADPGVAGSDEATAAAPAPDDAATADPSATAEATAPSGDTFQPAVLALTRDDEGRSATDEDFDAASIAEYGFNPDLEGEAVWLPFLAQAGGSLRDADGFALASPEGELAFRYLADLAAVHHPAPAATAEEAASAHELFLDGRLALLQSSSSELRQIAGSTSFSWGVAPVPAGPEGAVSVVDGVATAVSADSKNLDAALQVIRWLASTDGQSALASQGVGLPAAPGAQELFAQSWADQGVDVGAVLGAVGGPSVTAPSQPSVQRGVEAMVPVIAEIFRGELPVEEALPAAEDAADRAATP